MSDPEKSQRLSRDQCLAKASECQDMAARIANRPHHVMLEHMAETWERIASDFEKERLGGDDERRARSVGAVAVRLVHQM